MIQVESQALEQILQAAHLSFTWDGFTRTWQLERHGNDSSWKSVMYVAHDQAEAEQHALEHLHRFYKGVLVD